MQRELRESALTNTGCWMQKQLLVWVRGHFALPCTSQHPGSSCRVCSPLCTHCSDGCSHTRQTFSPENQGLLQCLHQVGRCCKFVIHLTLICHQLPCGFFNCRLVVLKLPDGLQTLRTHLQVSRRFSAHRMEIEDAPECTGLHRMFNRRGKTTTKKAKQK